MLHRVTTWTLVFLHEALNLTTTCHDLRHDVCW